MATDKFVFIDNVTTDQSRGLYYLDRFTPQLDSDHLKQPKTFKRKEVWNVLAMLITSHESKWARISLAEGKTENKKSQKQAGAETSHGEGLLDHQQVMFMAVIRQDQIMGQP